MDKKPDFVFNEYDRSPSRELIEKNRRRRKLRKASFDTSWYYSFNSFRIYDIPIIKGYVYKGHR